MFFVGAGNSITQMACTYTERTRIVLWEIGINRSPERVSMAYTRGRYIFCHLILVYAETSLSVTLTFYANVVGALTL